MTEAPPPNARRSFERLRPVLRSAPLLADLTEAELVRVARGARTLRAEPGGVVIEHGEPAGSLYLVATGKLKVVAPRRGGRDATLHVLGPGEVFGEIAMFQHDGRTARIVALEEAVLVALDRRELLDLVGRSNALSAKLLSLMAERLRATIAHFDATTSLDAEQRLASKLLQLAEHFGVPGPDGHVTLGIRLSQQDLGDMVDCSRQTVNRLLRKWQRAGLLARGTTQIVIADPGVLRTRRGPA
jgi:CRP/FNR family transcriptional regulator